MREKNNRQRIEAFIDRKTKKKSNWFDWRWQVAHTVRDLETAENLLGLKLKKDRREQIKKTVEKFPIAITPYYLSLIDTKNVDYDPIFMQSFPSIHELDSCPSEMSDPLQEDHDSPVKGITHRYPDRVLFLVSNLCSMYCRHCTRKRKVGDRDYIPNKAQIKKGLAYIRNTKQVRDVLLSGGDPLMLSDDYLEWILSELRKIPHVEIIRIGTRMPVVLPYRITSTLVKMLKKYHPLWINTHFNHPRELTESSREALRKLADAGIPLGNQTVLLSGINDCPRIMKILVQRLLINRVRPYYLYQCDLSEGLMHFRTPIGKGIEIMENLIGHTTGMAVPTYVIDAPGGGGKIPVMPNYLISWSTNKVILRNYEGVICTYKEPDSYEPIFCDRKCDDCKLQLNLEGAHEDKAVGIRKLIDDYNDTTSLTPQGTERIKRRNKKS
ncbi:MAG: lysine 2,3-aminomutase [Candidatus Omnitrophica bacterium]|nr:lysine 2,3-aminomutase [Candidatus Omnitrophota bacterium]MBU1047777.1 lysine 2,3-aminomutase [Candidatus Omnitrophota bacterium]MBU1631055.1 lysine 2,3-aminomutase [Candidatus Omnitrophota bacterium]MBU1767257.1 lysine 2,3-aminomutase [Candidatus Omnitrophota bacterium]MBU1889322.1 lysine 2,3-aminomutase [Candidatus Omnitrophota bacterium]